MKQRNGAAMARLAGRQERSRTLQSSSLATMTLATSLSLTLGTPASAQDTCRQGYVWREAFAGDHVCVTPETRAQAADDNRRAAERRQPGGGDYGPDTCRQGYVWREARPGDVVCVTPQTRSQAAHDNSQAAARRASTPAPGTAPASGYVLSNWSSWGRSAGIEYRYRWGFDPQSKRYANDVDAIFEVRNLQREPWEGAVRTLDCSSDTLYGSRRVVLRPNETQQVKFLTPNCGTQNRPSIRPNVVRSHRID
jgi:hypothetical protein